MVKTKQTGFEMKLYAGIFLQHLRERPFFSAQSDGAPNFLLIQTQPASFSQPGTS